MSQSLDDVGISFLTPINTLPGHYTMPLAADNEHLLEDNKRTSAVANLSLPQVHATPHMVRVHTVHCTKNYLLTKVGYTSRSIKLIKLFFTCYLTRTQNVRTQKRIYTPLKVLINILNLMTTCKDMLLNHCLGKTYPR